MKNKAKAIAIIKKDCKIRGHYLLKGQTCAVGALALESGIKKEVLSNAGTGKIIYMGSISSPVCIHFGLRIGELAQIQVLNDHYDTVEERRSAIVGFLNGL